MSVQSVKNLFSKNNLEHLVIYNDTISDTVINAAIMIGCEPSQIAKTMAFTIGDKPIVIVTSGESKIDNAKYKKRFNCKARLISYNDVERITGHKPGGICPFALNDGVEVYLDISLKRFDIVYAGGGDEHNTVKVTLKQLETLSNSSGWIDVCKN